MAMWGQIGGGGIEQKGQRTHGHGPQCGDCRVRWEVQGVYTVI